MTPTAPLSPSREIPRRLRNRLFLLLVFVTGTPLVIWAAFTFWGAGGVVTGFLEAETRDKTEDLAQNVENAKNLNATFARYIALQLRSTPRRDWQSIVLNMSRAEPDLYNVHVIAADGRNIVRSDEVASDRYRYDDRKYFQGAMTGTVTHEMVLSRAYHRPALCSGQKVDPENVVVAVCRFTDGLLDGIRKTQLGRRGYIVLLDEDNRVLAHPHLAFQSRELSPVEQAAAARAESGEIHYVVDEAPTAYSVYHRPLSGRWKLITIQDRSELTGWALQVLAWPMAAGVLTLILMTTLAYLVVDRGTRPLLKLTQATRHLGPHNLDLKVTVDTDDELGLLAEAFNEMTERLRVAFATLKFQESELQKSKTGLENLVLEQSQKLLYSTKMSSLGEMAGGIAHEVNNPLAIISMRAQKLRESVENGKLDRASILETLDKIEKTCVRINQIIRGLRAFSRDGSHDPFVRENLSSVVWEAASLCQEAMRNRGIDLQVQCDAEIEIECQPVQLGQVILNLLTNARDAVLDQPERWIRVEARQLDADGVQVTVTDSGRGIAKANIEKIMQPFFTTKEVGQGTGLGLSISKGIVQSHGGELTLNTESPRTQFVVRLPTRQKSPRAKIESGRD